MTENERSCNTAMYPSVFDMTVISFLSNFKYEVRCFPTLENASAMVMINRKTNLVIRKIADTVALDTALSFNYT
jgi:hypothetical protein